MPNYQTHDTIGIGLAIVSTVGTYTAELLSANQSVLLGVAIFLGTYVLSPDLDTDSMIYSRWGIFKWYWYPYKQLIAHRSIWSHSGPLSATIRLLYLCWIPLLIALILLPQYSTIYEIQQYIPALIIIWAGVVLSDIAHVVADIIVTSVRRIL